MLKINIQKYIHYKNNFYKILKAKSLNDKFLKTKSLNNTLLKTKLINPNYFDNKIKFYVEHILPISLIKKQYKFSQNIIKNSINQLIITNNKKFVIPYNTNNMILIKHYKKQGLNINDILYIILYHKTNINTINYLQINNIKLSLEDLKYIFIDSELNTFRHDWKKIIKYIHDFQLVKTFLISNCDNLLVFDYIENNLFNIQNDKHDYMIILNIDNSYYRRILLANYSSFYL
ncbi:hypothetical protein Hokovirus_3_17 [Hokovirus HKV1]|uniref:Uncharacterized protein n=1 Tax=Hokovirus HKV1 TaxID=1977638 RepID=A0A1V0SGH3_9VIRU|nr:hypothetical protein Hokovirus_3_17 [Hokovirus HKV1]